MNPPQWNSIVLLRGELSYTTSLWKNSVLAAFYAVFTDGWRQNGTKNALFAAFGLPSSAAPAGPADLDILQSHLQPWENAIMKRESFPRELRDL
jgi:hypothetical protein